MAQVLPAERDLRRVIGDGDGVPDGEVEGLDRERPARALPRARPAAHLRRALGRLPPPGPHRHVRDLLEPRGDAGRRDVRARRDDDWIFPSYRESAIGLLRGMPPATVLSWWRGHPAGWWNPLDYNVASICVPIATHVPHAAGLAWGKKLRGERRVRDRVLRRRRDLRGRVPRGRELRRRHARAADPLLQQQPVGDLDAALGADARPRRSPTRRSATACPACASTGGDVLAVYEATREAVDAGAGGRRADVHRGGHVPRGAARDRRRPERLHRPRAGRGGAGSASASAGTRATSAGSACSTTSSRSRSRPRRPRLMREGIAAAEAEPPRRSRAASSSTRTSSRRRRSRGSRRAAEDPRLAELTLVEAINDCLHVELGAGRRRCW